MHVAVAVMMLGYTRTNGVIGFNPETLAFDLITPAKAKKMIEDNELYGIKWKKDDFDMVEFYPDQDGWNQKDIMILSGLTYRPMINDIPGANILNTMYTVSKIIKDSRETTYEVVSNTFQRLTLTEEQLIELAGITIVAGVRIKEGIVVACDGLPVKQVETKDNEKRNTSKKKSTVNKEKCKTK